MSKYKKKKTYKTEPAKKEKKPEIIIDRSKNRMIFGIIILITFILYGNTLTHDYALDDAIAITQNDFTKAGIKGIGDIFSYDTFMGFFGKEKYLVSGGRYRPLSLVTFALEIELFGQSPGVSHFINILLYALTGILIFIILSRLLHKFKPDKWYLSIPFITTILYIAHPLHTEAIANIKGRDEIMTFLGSLLALHYTIRYLDTNKKKFLLLSSAVFFLGLLSKENAITFIAVIPLTVFFFTDHSLKRNITSLSPLILAAIIFLVIRQKVIGDHPNTIPSEIMNNPFLNTTFGEKYATIFFTLIIYVKLLFFPHPLTYDYYPYHIEITNWGDIWVILSFLIYLAMGIYALVLFKKKSIISYGILFYLITFSIVSNIIFPIGAFMNERFMYISSLGFCLIISYLLVVKLPRIIKNDSTYKTVLTGILGLFLILYSTKSITRNFAWKNDFVLFTTDVKTSTGSAKSNCSAGGKLIEESDKLEDEKKKMEYLEQALQYLERSVNIHPTYIDAWILKGNCHFKLNRDYNNAIACYKKVLAKNNNHDLAFENIVTILAGLDSTDYKLKVWEDLYEINPNRFEVNYSLGNLWGGKKRIPAKAIPYLERAVKIDPNSSMAFKDLGVAYAETHNYEKAIPFLEKAYSLNKEDKQLPVNIGITYKFLGAEMFNKSKDYHKALEYFSKAAKLIPKDPQLMYNLHLTHKQLGNTAEAAKYLQISKELSAKFKQQ